MVGKWDTAEDAVKLDRPENRVGSIANVSANHYAPHPPGRVGLGSSGGGTSVPDAVIDALVETVWAFPGLRVSLSRLTRSRHLRFLACAGPEEMSPVTGRTLRLDASTSFVGTLRTAEAPVEIEDVATDTRTKHIAAQLEKLGTQAFLLLPVRTQPPAPAGAVMFEAPRPRTWTAKEIAALERLEPLMALTLENQALREQLGRANASLGEYERRLGGVRGLVGSIVHDTNILVQGLLATIARATEASDPAMLTRELGEGATALGRQLEGVLAELIGLERGAARILEPLDLNALVLELAPALRSLLGRGTRLLTQLSSEPLRVPAHRTGLERTLLNLIVHAAGNRESSALALETRREGERAVLQIRGDALDADDALRLLGAAHSGPVTPDELGLGLWLVRCEVLLHGGSIQVDLETDGTPRIRFELPML